MTEYKYQVRFSPMFSSNPSEDCVWRDTDTICGIEREVALRHLRTMRSETIRYEYRMLEREVSEWKETDEMKTETKITKEQMEEELRKIVAEELCVSAESIKAESDFCAELGADYLDLIELILWTEERFGCSIADEDAEKARTFGKLLDAAWNAYTRFGK